MVPIYNQEKESFISCIIEMPKLDIMTYESIKAYIDYHFESTAQRYYTNLFKF